jgi:nucleoside-diphosphate-sugar epimerase
MLLARGYEVVGLDTDLYCKSVFGDGLIDVPTIATDVRDVRLSELTGFYAICHLAALSNDPLGNVDPDITFDINFEASVRLARLTKEAGVERFVFSSSCSSYGAAGDELLDENAASNPVTAYGISKVRSEREISQLADTAFSPTFLRNATAYGMSPKLRLDLVLNDFAASAYLDQRIFIKSDGTPWRPLVHVQDICRAFIATLEASRDQIHNEAFNIGRCAENYRVSELADIVAALVPHCKIEYDPAGGPDKRCYRVSCQKVTHRLPGFQPIWDVRRGANELLLAYDQFKLDRRDIQSLRYHRLPVLQRRQAEGLVDQSMRPLLSVS